MASNFGTNLQAWVANSHARRQINANSQGELQVTGSQVGVGSISHLGEQVVGQGSDWGSGKIGHTSG
jgi:hypothetical protein